MCRCDGNTKMDVLRNVFQDVKSKWLKVGSSGSLFFMMEMYLSVSFSQRPVCMGSTVVEQSKILFVKCR